MQSGLFYDQKNFTDFMAETYFRESGISYYSYKMNYLTLPFELKYKLNVTKGIQVFATSGLFVNYAMNGQYLVAGPLICDAYPQNVFSGDNNRLKRMDIGGQFGGGIAFNCGLYLKANYLRGFMNLSENENNKFSQ